MNEFHGITLDLVSGSNQGGPYSFTLQDIQTELRPYVQLHGLSLQLRASHHSTPYAALMHPRERGEIVAVYMAGLRSMLTGSLAGARSTRLLMCIQLYHPVLLHMYY